MAHELFLEPCPTEEEAASSQAKAKLRFVLTKVFRLSDGQALVGPGHEVRVALGDNGIVIPVEKTSEEKANQVGRRFHEFLSEEHQHKLLAEDFHFFVGK